MTDHPLAGVVVKLRNADEHMRRLEAATLAYLNGQPNAAIVSERNPNDSTRGLLLLKVIRQPPLEIAAITGDVVHNLRSALDYFVEELVKRNGHSPGVRHLFPIAKTPNDFKSAIGQGRLQGVHERAVRAIEGFQSYNVKPFARPTHPLNHLHTLSNRDKHHVLAISALNAESVWNFVAPDGRILRSDATTEPIHDGGVLADIPTEFVIDGTKAQLQLKLSVRVAFKEPEFIGSDVLGVLQRIRELIGMFMLPAFTVFFDPLPDDLHLTSHGLTSPSKPVDMVVGPNT